jgi:hypothetical protein
LVQLRFARPVDLAHVTFAEWRGDFVNTEMGARSRSKLLNITEVSNARTRVEAMLLALGFQSRLVLFEEPANLVRHVEQLRELLLVERDRKAAQTVDGDAAPFADLEAYTTARLARQALILRV